MMKYNYMVICVINKRERYNQQFEDYDSAFNFAKSKTENEGCTSIIQYFSYDSCTWRTGVTLVPPESC